MANNTYDLNIGHKCLENWSIDIALRELIANAIDEHTLSSVNLKPIIINWDNRTLHIIDYGTGIGPWWAQGPGLGRGFHRCICSSSGDCRCINDNQFENTSIYPQYYFN